jgi:hypothetical protein
MLAHLVTAIPIRRGCDASSSNLFADREATFGNPGFRRNDVRAPTDGNKRPPGRSIRDNRYSTGHRPGSSVDGRRPLPQNRPTRLPKRMYSEIAIS